MKIQILGGTIMRIENKVLCHWDMIRFVKEEHLINKDGTQRVLSVSNGEAFEYMIFLGKDDSNTGYEVMVYKSEPTDKYIPRVEDKVNHFEENDEYISFFFNSFEDAHNFVERLPYFHEEYKVRPTRKIEFEN